MVEVAAREKKPRLAASLTEGSPELMAARGSLRRSWEPLRARERPEPCLLDNVAKRRPLQLQGYSPPVAAIVERAFMGRHSGLCGSVIRFDPDSAASAAA